MSIQTQFQKLLHDIEPSPTTKKNASSTHTALRKFLREHSNFKEVHVDTFLSGSYKRDTAIRPRVRDGEEDRPDIDIIVVTNHTLNSNPNDVLDQLYTILKEKYEDIRKQTRSVGLSTSKADMDVVPIIAPSGVEGTLYIPDRKLNQWLVTNPPAHTSWTIEMNEAADGSFKPLVKLVKWWRRESSTIAKRPKGFVIECITAECMNLQESQFADLFIGMLEGVVDRYRLDIENDRVPVIADPAVLGNSVTDGMSFASFEGFYKKAEAHAKLGRDAQLEEDPDKALAMWRELFGNRFPKPGRSKNGDLLSAAFVPERLRFPDKPVVPKKPGGFA